FAGRRRGRAVRVGTFRQRRALVDLGRERFRRRAVEQCGLHLELGRRILRRLRQRVDAPLGRRPGDDLLGLTRGAAGPAVGGIERVGAAGQRDGLVGGERRRWPFAGRGLAAGRAARLREPGIVVGRGRYLGGVDDERHLQRRRRLLFGRRPRRERHA